MSSKQRIESLSKYISDLKNKLDSPIPEKHKERASSYYDYLESEIRKASTALESLRLTVTK